MDDSYYVGYSQDPQKRLEDHNDGRSRYTSGKRPWIKVYQEEYQTKSETIMRERFLKKQRNRIFYKKLPLARMFTCVRTVCSSPDEHSS